MTDTSSAWDRVRGIAPVSLCDWPGRVTCVLFAGGCNFHCPTCHNGQLAWAWKSLPVLDRDHILADLRRRRSWLDGLVLSGGEPASGPGLDDLLAELGELSLPVKVDSNGSAPDVLERLLASNLAQTLAVDVKGPWDRYPELTGGGMSAALARECLSAVFDLADAYPGRIYFRCTKVPTLSAADLDQTRTQVPEHLPLLFQEFVSPAKK